MAGSMGMSSFITEPARYFSALVQGSTLRTVSIRMCVDVQNQPHTMLTSRAECIMIFLANGAKIYYCLIKLMYLIMIDRCPAPPP